MSVIKVTKYSITQLKNHNVMLIGEIDASAIIKCDAKFGTPTNIETDPNYRPANATPAPVTRPAPPVASVAPPPPPQQPAAPHNPPQQYGNGYSSYNGRPAGMATTMEQTAPQTFVPPPPSIRPNPIYQQGDAPQMTSSNPGDVIYTPVCGLTPYQNTYPYFLCLV